MVYILQIELERRTGAAHTPVFMVITVAAEPNLGLLG
jgi:hypothetical protein